MTRMWMVDPQILCRQRRYYKDMRELDINHIEFLRWINFELSEAYEALLSEEDETHD